MFEAGESHFDDMVELPAETLGECRDAGRELGRRIREAFEREFAYDSGYRLEAFISPECELAGNVTHSNFSGTITTAVGQNSRYLSPSEPEQFFSLSVHADASIPSILEAEKIGETVATVTALLGAVGGGFVLFGCLWAMAELLGYFVISVGMVLGSLLAGAAVGVWVGMFFGNLLRARRVAGAERDRDVVSAVGAWEEFLGQVGGMLEEVRGDAGLDEQ
jgi:hypothetical protein